MANQSDIEMNDLRPRVVSIEHQLSDHHHRLTKMEEWRHHSDIADAKFEVKIGNMADKLNKIDSNLSRLMWLFITGIGGGIVAFLVNGGFKVP